MESAEVLLCDILLMRIVSTFMPSHLPCRKLSLILNQNRMPRVIQTNRMIRDCVLRDPGDSGTMEKMIRIADRTVPQLLMVICSKGLAL